MKIAVKKHENKSDGSKDSLEKLLDRTVDLKDDLLYIENQLVEDLETAIKDFDGKLSNLAKDMQDYVSGDLGFKRIIEAIKDFGSRLNDITKIELDRYQMAVNNSATNTNADMSEWEELQDLLENKETLLGTIGNIKDNLT